MKILKKTFLLIFSFFCAIFFSQTLSSNLDKTTLALGEVAVFKIQILDLNGQDVQASPRNELLPFHFEMVNDSIAKQKDIYLRSVKFAVFEEGKFTIPEIQVKVGDKILKTIPYEVEVINTAKKGDQINDIMKNKEVELNVQDYWEAQIKPCCYDESNIEGFGKTQKEKLHREWKFPCFLCGID